MESLILFIINLAIAFGYMYLVIKAMEVIDEPTQDKWYKTPLAFLCGFSSTLFLPTVVPVLTDFFIGYITFREGIMYNIFMFLAFVIGNAGIIYIGMIMFVAFCNATKTAEVLAWILFAIINVVFLFGIYTMANSGDIIKMIVYIGAVVVGALTIKSNMEKLKERINYKNENLNIR